MSSIDNITDPETAEYWQLCATILETIISVHKDHGMGVEYLYSFFQECKLDKDKLLEANWHACCEWDL